MNNKNLRVIAALDSYKGSISSFDAGCSVKRGFLRRLPNSIIDVFALGDGGEGTAAAFRQYGKSKFLSVCDTHLTKTSAEYVELSKDERLQAIFDMAQCSGLLKSVDHNLDILHATTYGVGEMIYALVYKGYKDIIIGLGGSGTNDAGIGALYAMGALFFDSNNREIDVSHGPITLPEIARIDLSNVLSLLSGVNLTLLYDVYCPLTGSNGASMLFSQQKGADAQTSIFLENALTNFSRMVDDVTCKKFSDVPGAGAAGGLGYGLSLVGGMLTPGAKYVLDYLNFSDALKKADLVITGEGRTDLQTANGKLPAIVANYARKNGCPVICLSGSYEPCVEINNIFDAVLSISNGPDTLENAIRNTATLLEETSYNIAGLYNRLSNL